MMRHATAFLSKPTATVAPIALVFCTTLISALSVDPSRLVESRFESALSDRSDAQTPVAIASVQSPGSPIAGSESYWLGTPATGRSPITKSVQPVVWAPPVAVGDHVRLSDAAGTAKTLEVTRIEPLHRAISAGTRPEAALWLVSCRDASAPDTGLIRLIVDENTKLQRLRQARDQSL